MDRKATILCVDDEQNVLNALRRLFIDEPYELVVANSGSEGLAIIEKRPVEIVISDYRMPGMNGIDFLREVATRWPLTVRIVLSGYADTASVVEAINEGQIYKFIPKPWNDDDLKVTVANAVERYHLYRKNAEMTSEMMRLNQELKQLLDEKTAFMELEGRMLSSTQSFFYSLPVAVLGVGSDGTVAQCNEAWATETGDHWESLGKSIETAYPPEVAGLVQAAILQGQASGPVVINGRSGRLFSNLLKVPDGVERGVVLVFLKEERCA